MRAGSRLSESAGRIDLIRAIAVAFALALAFVTLTGLLPGLADAQGRTFGIFKLNSYQNLLHTASALWAAVSAYLSRRAATKFLQIFGTLYFLDGLMGLAIGSGYLDLGFLIYGVLDLPMSFKLLASLPHLVLGGAALFSGFVLARSR